MRGYVEHPTDKDRFYAFERSNFGIIHVRTDGERVLALTHSGKKRSNEAYRFAVSATGEIRFSPKVTSEARPAEAMRR